MPKRSRKEVGQMLWRELQEGGKKPPSSPKPLRVVPSESEPVDDAKEDS